MANEMAWNDQFPPLNLYNYPAYGVVDVFAEAKRLGVAAMPGEWVQAVLYGETKEKKI